MPVPCGMVDGLPAGLKRSGMAPDRKSGATVGPLSGYCAAAAGRAASELEVA